ncbi:exported hypothetical protein [[Clostridium] ultunense Esp]|nr:exported hypothetical protein [[Clostridium] ultunense Esp]
MAVRIERMKRLTAIFAALFLLLSYSSFTHSSKAASGEIAQIALSAPATVAPGETFDVTISLKRAQDLYAIRLTLTWDADKAEPVNSTKPFTGGSFLSEMSELANEWNNQTGSATYMKTFLGKVPGQSGEGMVATLRLKMKEGSSGDLYIHVADGSQLVNSEPKSTPFTPQEASIRISTTDGGSGGGNGNGTPGTETVTGGTKETEVGQVTVKTDENGNTTAQLQVKPQVIYEQVNASDKKVIMINLGTQVIGAAKQVDVEMDQETTQALLQSGKPIQFAHDVFTLEIPSEELARWIKEGALVFSLMIEDKKADAPIFISAIAKIDFVSPILTIGESDQMLINPLHLTLKIETAQGVDSRLVGAYRRGKDGRWSYVGSPLQWKSSELEIYTTRLGSFAAIRYEKSFADIANHWAKIPIEVLASQHLLKGKNDNHFSPEGKITRAEFAAMLVRMLGLEGESYKGSFQDVKSTDWFVSEVESAVKVGIVTGYQGKFRPGAYITRQDMVVMLLRAAQLTEKSLAKGGQVSLNAFSDKEEISSYAKEAVAVAVANRIINGMADHRFVPMGDATRAQAAKALYQFLYGNQ